MSESVVSPSSSPTDESEARSPTALWLGLIAPALVGLCTSTILLVDYLKPAPVFCGASGSCAALRHSMLAYPGGVPLPAFGVLGFATLAGLFFARGERARAAHLAIAGMSAVVGAALLAFQLVLGKICVYCTITDVCALLTLATAYARARRAIDPPREIPALALAGGFALSAVSAPIGLGMTLEPPVPQAVADEMRATPRGQLTIIDFVDFQCPYCRQTHTDLAPLLAQHRDKIRLVRRHVPLSFHTFAMDAARASCCAEDMGKGDAMADRLMSAPVKELTPEGCASIAAELGLDVAEFKRCVADPKTAQRIERDKQIFQAVGGEGLPTLYIGAEKIEGAQGPEALRRAIDHALAGS